MNTGADLYEDDFSLWTQAQAEALRAEARDLADTGLVGEASVNPDLMWSLAQVLGEVDDPLELA